MNKKRKYTKVQDDDKIYGDPPRCPKPNCLSTNLSVIRTNQWFYRSGHRNGLPFNRQRVRYYKCIDCKKVFTLMHFHHFPFGEENENNVQPLETPPENSL